MLSPARTTFSRRILQQTSSAHLRRYFRPHLSPLRHYASGQDGSRSEPPPESPQGSTTNRISRALQTAASADSGLLAPVHIPEDPHSILKERHPAFPILSNSTIVVTREMEMMNVMLGYEEANKYAIMDPHGNHIGYMAEQDRGMGRMMTRQLLRTHRSFTTHIFDRHMKEVLRFYRPFSYINSSIGVYDPIEVALGSYSKSKELQNVTAGDLSTTDGQLAPQTSPLALGDMRLIGEAKQQWAPLRRKYNLFFARPADESPASDTNQAMVMEQFAHVNAPFLSWDFPLDSEDSQTIGSVTRNFTNLGRELFTDAGCYALRMDSAMPQDNVMPGQAGQTDLLPHNKSLTLDQRAVMLATAVTVDYDYFSRERSGFFSGMPFLWMGGGGAEGAGAAGAAGAGAEGAAGAAGAAGTEVAGTAAGGLARGAAGGATGAGEGAIAGAGSLGAYEAMQQARERGQAPADDASPVNSQYPPPENQSPEQQASQDQPWWEQQNQQGSDDMWGGQQGPQMPDGGDGEGGKGVVDWLSDFFDE